MQRQRNQRNNLALVACLLFFLAGASVAQASATSGTIDSTHKYAWGNVAGYVNFAPANGGLTVTDSAITGYAWAANTGWINFNASQSHVTNDSNGTLGGFAWDSGGGWVSFTGVTIDTSGKFHGTATGGTVNGASYSISFDCTNCDVRTDWRPASVRPSSSSGGGYGSISPIIIPAPLNASSTVTTVTTVTKVSSPSPITSGVSGKNNPNTKNLTSTTTTTFKNSVASSTTHATTTATTKTTVSSSIINFIRSAWWIVLAAIFILALFLFFGRF